jgi:chromosome segregation ATPase
MPTSSKKQLSPDDSVKLDSGADEAGLQTGDDLALAALSQASQDTPALDEADSELAESDRLAETLTSLQNLIERNANELQSLADKLKEKRDSLRNVFNNDGTLTDVQDKAKEATQEVKTRKSQLQADPQVTSLKVEIGELSEQKKEIEETLSNHLVNYHQLTNSTSFDTSDGDQWEFKIQARIKPRRKKQD